MVSDEAEVFWWERTRYRRFHKGLLGAYQRLSTKPRCLSLSTTAKPALSRVPLYPSSYVPQKTSYGPFVLVDGSSSQILTVVEVLRCGIALGLR